MAWPALRRVALDEIAAGVETLDQADVDATEPAIEQREAPRDDRSRGRGSRFSDLAPIVLAVVVGFVVRAIFAAGDHIVGTDESTYLTSGLNFWAGHGFTSSGRPELHFPPGLPFLLGGVHELIGGDPHTATVLVNLVTTTLVIVPIAGLVYMIAGRRAAVLAAWIAAFCPAIVWLPLSAGGSLGLFTFLTVSALWLGASCAGWRLRWSLLGSAGCGFLIGWAYLTRPEGLFYSIVLLGLLVLPALGGWRGIRRAGAAAWRRAGFLVLAFTISLLLFMVPYAAYLRTNVGSWQLTAKANAMSLESWRAVAKGQRSAAIADMFTLDASGYRFRPVQSVSGLVRHDPGAFAGIVGVNVGRLADTIFVPTDTTPYPSWQLIPGALLLLAGFAVFRRRHDRVIVAVGAAIAIPVITAITYFVLPRYLIPSAALVCVLVAVGLRELPRRWAGAATIAVFVLLVSSTAAGLHDPTNGWFHPSEESPEHRAAGLWLAEHSGRDDLVMSTNQTVGYYAHRKIMSIPYASEEKILDFGRHFGARFLVVDQVHAVRQRPQLRPLLRNAAAGLRAVHRLREGARTTVIYEFVPRPDRFDGRVPLLDHIGEAG